MSRPVLILAIVLAGSSVASANGDDWFAMLGTAPDPAQAQAQYDAMSAELGSHPVRAMRGRAARHAAQHPTFVSMTTSPQRLTFLKPVLDSLDLTHVDKVLLTLPETFGRTGDRYTIPAWIREHPKIQILRIGADLGPISKMLPAIEHARAIDPDALVISIDDDVGYPRGMVNEMIHHLSGSRRTVYTGSAWRVYPTRTKAARPPVGIPRRDWPAWRDLTGRVVEGWAGIGYRAGDIDTAMLRHLSQLDKDTRTSDDLVISYVLAATGVRKRTIANRFFASSMIRHFPHGFGEDALHRGAGVAAAHASVPVLDHTGPKYLRAISSLNDATQRARRGLRTVRR